MVSMLGIYCKGSPEEATHAIVDKYDRTETVDVFMDRVENGTYRAEKCIYNIENGFLGTEKAGETHTESQKCTECQVGHDIL